MDVAKRTENLEATLLFIYLVTFPLGQILRIGYPLTDIIPGIFALLYFKKALKLKWFRQILLILAFTYIVSVFLFYPSNTVIGFLYLIRLVSYLTFSVGIFNFLKRGIRNAEILLNSLILVSVFSAVWGWIQYLVLPDLRPFTVFGWDDHLYRLAGTFIDPGFTAILLVLGLIVSLAKFLQTRKRQYLLSAVFLTLAAAFTYSRAGYLALIAGVLTLLGMYRKARIILFIFLAFSLLIILLPDFASEGTNLLRTRSIEARMENYAETLKVIDKNPLFGVGYNNLCFAKSKYFNFIKTGSHACSGSDSSLLFILATTGIIGFTVFIQDIFKLLPNVDNKLFSRALFYSTLVALFVNSIFINSLFYPWVMGWLAILIPICLKSGVKSNKK